MSTALLAGWGGVGLCSCRRGGVLSCLADVAAVLLLVGCGIASLLQLWGAGVEGVLACEQAVPSVPLAGALLLSCGGQIAGTAVGVGRVVQ